mgnify:CR=1 FL=1
MVGNSHQASCQPFFFEKVLPFGFNVVDLCEIIILSNHSSFEIYGFDT